MAEHVLMKTLRRHMARTKNILKEGHSDDAAASGGSAEKTASLKTHSPAGQQADEVATEPRSGCRQECVSEAQQHTAPIGSIAWRGSSAKSESRSGRKPFED